MSHGKWVVASLLGLALALPALALAQSVPADPAPVVVAIAGDIAGPWSEDTATGDLIRADASIERVLTVGDNAYENGSPSEYAEFYDPAWGDFKDKTLPVPGNHDWQTPDAAGYREYFGLPTHYLTDLGDWRLIALDSETCDSSAFLQDALATAGDRNVLAYWHHPLLNVGTEHGNEIKDCVRDWVGTLEAAHAELVVTGHDHSYQRFEPVNGVRHFVAGTGGQLGDGLTNGDPDEVHLEEGIANQPGVLRLELGVDSYSWSFVTPDGVQDSGTQPIDASSTPAPTPSVAPTPTPSVEPTPTPTESATPEATPSAQPTPTPTTSPTPGPVGDRCFIAALYVVEHPDGTIDRMEAPRGEVPCAAPVSPSPGVSPTPEPRPTPTPTASADRCFFGAAYFVEHPDGGVDQVESPLEEVACGSPLVPSAEPSVEPSSAPASTDPYRGAITSTKRLYRASSKGS